MKKTCIFPALLLLLSTACNSESKEEKAARLLYEQAQELISTGDPSAAIQTLDSLKSAYPNVIKWQREAMNLRPHAIIAYSQKRLDEIDDSVQILTGQLQQQEAKLLTINDPRLVEPYKVDRASYTEGFMNTTGVQARVSDIGEFYLVSSINPGSNHHTGLSATTPDGSQATAGPVAYDGELNYRINNSETITFSPEQSQPLGALASTNPGKIKIQFTGGKPLTLNLSAKQAEGIANCYNYAMTRQSGSRLIFEKERLQRTIDLAQNQLDRLSKTQETN